MCCVKLEIIELMVHSCHGLVSLPHTHTHTCSDLPQGSVCVSSDLAPHMQCCGNLTSHMSSYVRHAVERKQWFSESALMNRSVPLAFASL